MKTCLEANRRALIAVATGDAQVPSRLALAYQNGKDTAAAAEDWSLFKPASLTSLSQQQTSNNPCYQTVSMGMKVVSVRAQNPEHGYPLVPAAVLHMDPSTIIDAVLAGTYLNGARTAAGSALAIQHHQKRAPI
jgi:ornithine cyclodeaminase/alanine dehydrogenase-like protein (mu-crystallin family)